MHKAPSTVLYRMQFSTMHSELGITPFTETGDKVRLSQFVMKMKCKYKKRMHMFVINAKKT